MFFQSFPVTQIVITIIINYKTNNLHIIQEPFELEK